MFFSSIGYSQDIWISDVKNLTVSGPAVGNRDLTFGVRNILEEIVQDNDIYINPNSNVKLLVEIIYFDVKKTSVQVGTFGKKTDATEIILRGTLTVDKVDNKPIIVKGQAKSISTATLIIDQGGKFSQTDLSTAMKKVCEQLINELKL
jgi:hypothetical protein